MPSSNFDERANQLLADEIARWRTLSFDDLVPLVGMSGRTVLDEAIELLLAVTVRWGDVQHRAVRIRVVVQATLPMWVSRIEQAIVVTGTAPSGMQIDATRGSAVDRSAMIESNGSIYLRSSLRFTATPDR